MLTVNEQLLNRTIAHHIAVQRLANGAVQQILALLQKSDAEIFEIIRRYLDESSRRVDSALATISNINTRVYDEIGDELNSQLKELARYEVEYHQDLLESVVPQLSTSRPKLKFIRAIVDEEPMQGGLLDEWVEGMAQGRFTRVRQAVRTGAFAEETADTIIRRIRGRRSLNYRDGKSEISRRSARAIVGTFFNHVANRARTTLYGKNQDIITGYLWSAVLDDRTCEVCAGVDGTMYSAEEAFVLEESANGPPAHINCRCLLIPVLSSWEDLDVHPDDLTDDQKQAWNGKKPAKLTYQQWMEQQDVETQKDILGQARALMFRRGLPIKKFTNNTGRTYTLKELRKLESKKLTVRRPRRTLISRQMLTKRLNLGWKPDLPDQRDFLYAASEEGQRDTALPVRLSLRDKMPPVFNQGALGSCTSNALCAAVMYAHGPETPMLSRLDLYYKERLLEDTISEDAGAELRDGIKALAKWGVATEETWPYKIRSYRTEPSDEAAAEDHKFKIKEYMRLKGHDDFMKCLSQGYPFVGGFSVYENFDEPTVVNKGILEVPEVTEKMMGGHAVLYVGYDTDFHNSQVFRDSGLHTSQVPSVMYEVRNSFGEVWGDDGYFWMPADYVEDRDLSDDFWTIRL